MRAPTLNSKTDYYAILGAGEDASPRELERLYRQQAHKRHPDRGGSDEDMKTLNEAYQVLRNENSRREYDACRRGPKIHNAHVNSASAAREVGVYGQVLSSLLCMILGLMLLFLVRFNGLWFLWPLSILAIGVIFFGVFMGHAAMNAARASLAISNPLRRLRVVQEIIFWFVVGCGGYGVYLVLTST